MSDYDDFRAFIEAELNKDPAEKRRQQRREQYLDAIQMSRKMDALRKAMAQGLGSAVPTPPPAYTQQMPSPFSFFPSPPPQQFNNSNNEEMTFEEIKPKLKTFNFETSEIKIGQELYLYDDYNDKYYLYKVSRIVDSRLIRGTKYYGTSTSTGVDYSDYGIIRKPDGTWDADGNGRGYTYYVPEAPKAKVGMDTVVLAQEKKDQILAAIAQVELSKKIFEEWGFSEVFEKGTAVTMLFYGTPGTGKTLMAQAIADQLGYTLQIIGTGDIETSEPGGAERNMMALFAKNKGEKNIILFDECDSLLSSREEVGTIMAAQINCLLSEIEKYDGVVIFTTNRLGKLDPALERRIAAKIEFPFPDEKQRIDIWKRMIPSKAPISPDVDWTVLAKKYKIAGGNIKNAVLNAARMSAFNKLDTISMESFENAAKKELESISAFKKAYGDSSHYENLGGGKGELRRDFGKLSVGKKEKMDKEETLKSLEGDKQ